MQQTCKYCDTLHKAISGHNYCSMAGDNIEAVQTNAFYFNSNSLISGEHISRFSIRTISDGYHSHFVKNDKYSLDKNHFLIIPQGESFQSQIETNNPVEGLLVAFQNNDLMQVDYFLNSSDQKLLDQPFSPPQKTIQISDLPIKFKIGPEMLVYLNSLKEAIKVGGYDRLWFEETFQHILQLVLLENEVLEKKINDFQCSKLSTKKELFKRIQQSGNFIEENMQSDLSLKVLSKQATMSTFHYLRTFKQFYNQTPHQFLTNVRLEKAAFMIRDTDLEIRELAQQVGFQNASSFSRLFKSKLLLSPIAYREMYRSNRHGNRA